MPDKSHVAKHSRRPIDGEDITIEFSKKTVAALRDLYGKVKDRPDFDSDALILLEDMSLGKPIELQDALINLAIIGNNTQKGELLEVSSSLKDRSHSKWAVAVTEIRGLPSAKKSQRE